MLEKSKLVEALERIKPPGHLCAVFETEEERFQVAAPFIRLGLERHEKCLYIARERSLIPLRSALAAEGIDVERAIGSGALTITTVVEGGHLKDGYFEPERMYEFWKEASEEARARGFSALRVTGEVDWLGHDAPGLERWMEYESRVTEILARHNCIALCQYDCQSSSPALILDVIRTHPTVVYGGMVCRNFYFVPPEEFVGGGSTAAEAQRWLRNIQERERAEEELQHERAVLHGILNATDVMLVYLDRDFNFVAVNPAYAGTCQMRPEEMIGKNHFALYPSAEVEAIFRSVRDTGQPVFYRDRPFEFPDQPERGVTYWDWSLMPVKNSGGAVTGLVFSLRETTKYVHEHRRTEQIIRELSTPVLPAREGLLIAPLIGAIDPPRARQLTQQLLAGIRQNRARVVVVDVTGVATMDSAVANHLIQTAEASRLLGAQVILTGVSTAVAQTLVTIGANLASLKTLGDLQSGIEEANRLLEGNEGVGRHSAAAKARAALGAR